MFLIGFFYIKRKVVWYLIFIYINWGFFGCLKNYFVIISSDKRYFMYKRYIKENVEMNWREFVRKISFGIIVLLKYIC